MDHFSAHGLWHPPDQLSSIFPLTLRGIPPLLHAPHTQAGRSGAYMVLHTISAQKFNGDAFKTQFHLSKSRSQNPAPILKDDFLTHQYGNPWWQSEDHSRIPTTWPCRSWVGNFIQDYSKGHSQRLYIISIRCQGINYFNTSWTAQVVHTGANQSTCMYLAQLGQLIFHCGNSITQFKFQDGQICIDPIQTIQLVTHLPG
ncbi:hypothetical protein O181_118689 [Austropuccinia psidii MF-1]|uniref:Uncharacterized protein n=1 Tax=Austropuccinia psidii MF-1 TaxID=1389203 RepID=A0A9Q3PYQ3_9BASI|nr:hypothetical protein [Austropuccinia psidii MF-1]